MPKNHYLTIAAAAILGLSSLSTALAGTETASPGKESKETKQVTPPCPVTYITGDFGVTFTSEYLSHGIVQAKQTKGVIAEPYLDLYIKLYSGTGFINSVSAQLSFWSNIGSNHDTAAKDATAQDWYEFDWDPGISIVFAKSFTLTVQYFEYDSPASVFNAARSINANLAYDDTSWWANTPLGSGNFAVHPHFTVLYELGGEAGHNLPPGAAGLVVANANGEGGWTGGHGWYYEIGIAPSYTFLPKATYPITLAIPTTVGLGDTGFYLGNNFGYLAVGPSISVPLAFIPSGFGSWTLTGAYTYYYEGTTVRAANAPLTGNGADSRHVFSGAIGCTF